MAGEVFADLVQETATITGTGNYTLSGAVSGFFTFAASVGASAVVRCRVWSVGVGGIPDGVGEEIGQYTLTGSTTLARTSVSKSSNSNAAVNWPSSTNVRISLVEDAKLQDRFRRLVGLKLSLTTGVPITTADVIGATSLRLVPYVDNQISLYDTTRLQWVTHDTAEKSLTLSALTSGKNYDLFVYDNGASTYPSVSGTASQSGGGTQVVTLPTNASGDLMLVFQSTDGGAWNGGGGVWTAVTGSAGSVRQHRCWKKVSTGSEASVSVASSGGSDNNVTVVVLTGSSPFVDVFATMATGSGTSVTATSVTTTQANDILINSYARDSNSGTFPTAPGGQTAVTNGKMTVGYETVASAGSTGTRTATQLTGAWTALTVAVGSVLNGGVQMALSSAWTDDTTRTDALTTQDGVLVKSSDKSRRYLGTFRTTSATTTEDSAANRFLFDYTWPDLWKATSNTKRLYYAGYSTQSMATVAATGAYSDLSGTPTIPAERNLVINSDFSRLPGQTRTTLTGYGDKVYTATNWFIQQENSGSVTVRNWSSGDSTPPVAFTVLGSSYFQFKNVGGTPLSYLFGQYIEPQGPNGLSAAMLQAVAIVMSIKAVASSGTPTLKIAIRERTATGSAPTFPVSSWSSNVPTFQTTNYASVATGSAALNTSTATTITCTGTPSSSCVGLWVLFWIEGLAGNESIYVSQASLTRGSPAPSSWSPHPSDEELSLRCAFKIGGNVANEILGYGGTISTTSARILINAPVPMRAVPTMTLYASTADFTIYQGGHGSATSVNPSAINVSSLSSVSQIGLNCTVTGLTAFATQELAANNTGGWLAFRSELMPV